MFFIRDGMQFPDLVHCLRSNPKNNIQESWRILDFLSFHPESVNIVSGCRARCATGMDSNHMMFGNGMLHLESAV